MTSVRWSHASPLRMSSFTGAENSGCLESERKTRIFHTSFYHVIYYIPIRAIRNEHFGLAFLIGFGTRLTVTTVGEPPWAWHDAGSEGIQSSPRFLTCGQLFRPTRPGWEDGSHGFPRRGILTCEVSKLLDRHGKYKYDDAAPDEDEPRHLDLSEKKGGKTIWSKFEPVRICNRCNLLRIRRCLHCLEPCLQEVFGRVGTKRNLSGFSYQATRNMATFIPCAYPLHWMLMLNTDTGCICILGAYNAVSYHSYHASDW